MSHLTLALAAAAEHDNIKIIRLHYRERKIYTKATAMDESQASSSTLSGDGNTIVRCSLQSCTIINSSVKRCSLNDCILSNVEYASRSTAKTSNFQDVALMKRSAITESVLQGRSSVKRSTLKKAVIMDQCDLKRSTITGTTILKSQIERASLTDCDVAECVVSRSDFKGMILKYGVWKKGILVGRIGDREPVAIKMDALGAEVSRLIWNMRMSIG